MQRLAGSAFVAGALHPPQWAPTAATSFARVAGTDHGKAVMRALTLDRAKAIYRTAVDSTASDGEGADWWAEVHAELREVVAARTAAGAATVIAWWHHDWSMVGDTAKAAAQRIRSAARVVGR
jgi:hypothetical protein